MFEVLSSVSWIIFEVFLFLKLSAYVLLFSIWVF